MARHARDGGAADAQPMTMPPRLRNLVLVVHVASSVGMLGAVASFLALAIIGLVMPDGGLARAAYLAMKAIAWLVIVPLILAALLVGIAESLATPWGLFRHWWVVAKLVLTVVATVVLLLQMNLIDGVAAFASAAALPPALGQARMALVLHSGGGLVVLIVAVVLSVYKPRGRTLYA
ncbi:MAG: hypothetical protein WDM84_05420 [Bauldia sp.]